MAKMIAPARSVSEMAMTGDRTAIACECSARLSRTSRTADLVFGGART
jgi:hypothetical protein